VFITAFTFIKLGDIKDPIPSVDEQGRPLALADGAQLASTDLKAVDGPQMKIVVNGQQYVWRYRYPGRENLLVYSDMVVPVGMTVILDIQADDVVHSWWIPKLGGKMDAVPGYTNKTWFKIPEDAIPEGEDQVVYNGQCAELCGRNHANMLGNVIGMRYPDYKAWVDRKAQEIETAREQAAEHREEIEQQDAQ
jgi:cytochrome c oxidase subunit II